ncbi:MAG: ABC transporter permease subunit [Isosphaeraceae bacterium]|nr:ABC transporter permease subunit [Isosphaeraceae bacterium]
MRHLPTLLKRELSSYFLSATAYLILCAFLVIAWVNFFELLTSLSRNTLFYSGRSDPLNSYISGSFSFWIAVMIAVPALTMRLFADERRSGTIETLLTIPVTELEVVVAKWLAGVIMFSISMIPFAMYLPFLRIQGGYAFDVGPVLSLGIGLLSVGMMFTAIGVFFSSLTKSQIVAAIWTFTAIFGLLLTQLAHQYAVYKRSSWADGIEFLSVLHQVARFGEGRLDLRYLALHASVTVFLLYLTMKVIEWRRES